MGFSEWRATRHMKTPVRGIFRVTGFYDVRGGTHITGVITAPGVPATPAEHKTDKRGRWAGNDELPVAVDQADPAKFMILWDEVDSVSWGSQELQAAQQLADRMNAGLDGGPGTGGWGTGAGGNGTPGAGAPFQFPGMPGAVFDGFTGPPGTGFSSGTSFVSGVAIGPDGQPVQLSGDVAAQVAEAVRETLGGISAAFAGPNGGIGAGPNGGFGAANGGFGAGPNGGFTPAQAAQAVSSQSGEQGTAVVLDAREVPTPPGFAVPPGGRAELLLEVTRADGTLYQTRTMIAFSTPERRTAIAAPGTRLRVRIDPNAPDRVAIDLTGMF
jgi:hypothetical protein